MENLSRRVAITSLCAAVAVPVSINTAASNPYILDPVATLKRVEFVIDRLLTRYICEGWSANVEECERMLKHFRREASEPGYKAGEAEHQTEFEFVIDFTHRNRQSLDWIYFGDPGGMICHSAAHSEQAGAVQS